MIDKREIELAIRASLKGGRDLESITKSIKDLQKAIEEQGDAAKKGESSLEGLKASGAALAVVQKELAARFKDVSDLDALTKKIKAQSEAVDKAGQKLKDFQAGLGKDATEAQQQRVQKLTKSYEAQQTRLASLQQGQERLQEVLRTAGVDTGKLTEESIRIVKQQEALAVSQNRVNQELLDYTTNLTKARAAAAALEATQAGLLGKLRSGNEADARHAAEQVARQLEGQQKLAKLESGNEADRLLAVRQREADLIDRMQRGNAADLRLMQQQTQEADKLAKLERGNEADARLGALQRQEEVLRRIRAGNEADLRLMQQQTEQAAKLAVLQGGNEADARLAKLQQQAALLDRMRKGNEADLRVVVQQGDAARKASQADQQAARDADLFAAAEKRAADATLRRAQAQAEFLSKQTARRGEAVGDQRLAEEQAAALNRARELAALKADIEQRSGDTTRDTTFTKTAAAAEATSRSFTTLARASTDLRPKVVSLRDAIEEIINPGSRAVQTIGNVEAKIKDLNQAIQTSRGPVKDFSGQFEELVKAQKSVSSQADLIDTFRAQIEQLRRLRTEFIEARTKVNEYAVAMRAGGAASGEFNPTALENKLKAAAKAFKDQIIAARDTQGALRAAGLSTNDLAASEQRLIGATQASTAAINALNSAVERNGKEIENSSRKFSLFGGEGRTTLSFVQRLRGEVLALTTAYVGIQGAIGLAKDSLEAFNKNAALQSGISFAIGSVDPAKIAAEIQFIRNEADRLGISFEHASKGYAKFAASTLKSGASLEEMRFIFKTFSEASRTLGLAPEELNRVFLAIGQIFSKGKIQAEEFKQQLGEVLPGLAAVGQEALKGKFKDLNKAMEEGKVGAENFLAIAIEYRKFAAVSLPSAIKSMAAEQGRFNNSLLFFKQQIAEAGFAKAYTDLLIQLTELMKGADSKQLVQALSDIASKFVQGVSFIVTYRDEFKSLVFVLAGVLSAKLFANLAEGVLTLNKALIASEAILGLTTKAAGLLTFALRAVFAALLIGPAAFEFGTWLTQFKWIQKEGLDLVRVFMEIIAHIKAVVTEFTDNMPLYFVNSFKDSINAITLFGRKLLQAYSDIWRALGLVAIPNLLDNLVKTMTLNPLSKSRTELEKELAAIRLTVKEMNAEIDQVDQTGGNARPGLFHEQFRAQELRTEVEIAPRSRTGKIGPTDQEIKHFQSEIEQLANALKQLQAGTHKKQGESLEAQLTAVDEQFSQLKLNIAKLGGKEFGGLGKKEGAAFMAAFNEAISERKNEVRTDFLKKIEDETEQGLKKVEQLEAQAGRKNKDELKARLDAIEEANRAELRRLEILRDLAVAAGDIRDADKLEVLIERNKRAVEELQRLETLKVKREEIQKIEQAINDLIKAREQTLKNIQDKVTAKELTSGQGDTASQQAIAEAQPAIDALVQQALVLAQANKAAFAPGELEKFIELLKKAAGSGAAVAKEFDRVGAIVDKGIDTGINAGLNAIADTMAKIINRTADWGDLFDNVGKAILATLAEVLRAIAIEIIKRQILLAIAEAQAAAEAARVAIAVGSAAFVHGGGVIGRGQGSRTVDASWFQGAPRYKGGGIVGLQPNEVPAILHNHEQVLSADDPDNVVNGGPRRKQANDKGTRFVLVDDRARVHEAMAGPAGESVIVRAVKRNVATLRPLFQK